MISFNAIEVEQGESLIKIKNTRNGQKPVQFYVPKVIKDLSEEISNAKIINLSEFKNISDFLRTAYKKFVYYLLIKDGKIDSIPDFDRKKIELQAQLKFSDKKDTIGNLAPFLAGI